MHAYGIVPRQVFIQNIWSAARHCATDLMKVEGNQVSAAGPKIPGITISELNLLLNPFGCDYKLGN